MSDGRACRSIVTGLAMLLVSAGGLGASRGVCAAVTDEEEADSLGIVIGFAAEPGRVAEVIVELMLGILPPTAGEAGD